MLFRSRAGLQPADRFGVSQNFRPGHGGTQREADGRRDTRGVCWENELLRTRDYRMGLGPVTVRQAGRQKAAVPSRLDRLLDETPSQNAGAKMQAAVIAGTMTAAKLISRPL